MTFDAFLRDLGIIPPDSFHLDRWQRCATIAHDRKKNASVKLDESGRYGWAVNFETGNTAHKWDEGGIVERTKEEIALANAKLSERIRERKELETQAIIRARHAYVTSEPLKFAAHEYLQRKRCDMLGCAGLKVDKEGCLVVPMYRDGRIVSIQRIWPDGKKRFMTNAPSKGATFKIWRPGSTVTILCEGLATGLTLFSAVPQAHVIVCFSAGNMVEVAKRETWSGFVAIGADSDHDTEDNLGSNPGKEKAAEAAKAIGCGWVAPEHIYGTDWNDYFCDRMAIIEEAEKLKQWPRSPIKLREAALLPIRTAIMGAMKYIPK